MRSFEFFCLHFLTSLSSFFPYISPFQNSISFLKIVSVDRFNAEVAGLNDKNTKDREVRKFIGIDVRDKW
ncbi:MAG: hypothetical protein EA361_00640 [Bacteroidetes bacterium]|nr:MAG: hypothetical protein EA361_00640 [Bacteroidota bacterium]